MSITSFDIINNKFTNSTINRLECEPETVCPICKAKISPSYISSISYDKKNVLHTTLLNFCTGCKNPFLSTYLSSQKSNGSSTHAQTSFLGSEPCKFVEAEFQDYIATLSPQFVKIYNQSLAAETSGLDEIAGLGYRKSLEFLIKDFAIHNHPDKEEEIKSKMLSPCIRDYIDSEQIRTLASRSTWIGNDEAHYLRKQENRDVSDMKRFIQAIVYFIGMVLISEDAASIDPA